jgi:hypothetical protein
VNIYEMYVQNGNRADFWVRRAKWTTVIARVVDVASKTEGPLTGTPPYYGNPSVTAQFFNVHTGDPLGGEARVLMEEFAPLRSRSTDHERPLSCPGTYAYTLIPTSELPDWAKTPAEREAT